MHKSDALHRTVDLFAEYQQLVDGLQSENIDLRAEVARLSSLLSDELKVLALFVKGHRGDVNVMPVVREAEAARPEPPKLLPVPKKEFGSAVCRCGVTFTKLKQSQKVCADCRKQSFIERGRKMAAARKRAGGYDTRPIIESDLRRVSDWSGK